MRDAQRHIPLKIRDDTSHRRYAKGGLASHAKKVRDAGRYGDDMIVHINRGEFEQLRQAWGEPTINPETGAPEYFLSGLRKWFSENPAASAVLPAAASLFLPGIGQTVGEFANVGGVLGNYAGTVGNALVGGALGAVTGGGTGALIGAGSGALAPSVAGLLGMNGILPGATGNSLFSGLTSGAGAASAAGGVRDSSIAAANGVTGGNTAAGGAGAAGGILSGLSKMSPEKMLIALGSLGTIAGAFHKQKDPGLVAAQGRQAEADAAVNKPLPQVNFNRTRTAMGDPRTYGMRPQEQFFAGNALPTVQAARGGHMPGYEQGGLSAASRYVEGPGSGRDDKIPAMLSDGEYVMDAETVAMIGDGSNKTGAQRLDAMRESLRQHKGKALAKGKFSPDAKDPMHYLGGLNAGR